MTTARAEGGSSASFLAGGGELGALLRNRDWTATSLGAPENWPQSLKIAVRIMLTSRQPIWVGWGSELSFFYNDAYRAIIGGKHPSALGRPTSEVWDEIWADIGPMLATAMGGVEGTYVEEQLLLMERNGYREETYYTFSYSPIPDGEGAGGIICANADDTQRVIGERQLALLRDLSAATADTRSWRDVCQRAAAALTTNPHDLPFALIYMAEIDGSTLSLVGSSGIRPGHPAAAESVPIDSAEPWPFADAFRRDGPRLVTDLAGKFPEPLPTGAWKEALTHVALLPVLSAGAIGRRGVLIVGLNPCRLVDGNYQDFLGLVTGQVAAAVANAEAYEQERRRAESLAQIDRVKTNFFSNVRHEFRTPLTLMLGPLEEALAEADLLMPRERERVKTVHRNGLRLLKLVNSLLDFSRIEAGRARATFEPTDLAALTAELASNFRSATAKAGLTLRIDCPPLPQPVYVDRDMHVGENRSQSPVERIQVHFRGRHQSGGRAGRACGSVECRGYGYRHCKLGAAEIVRALSPHRGRAHLPSGQIRGGRGPGFTATNAQAFVEEVLRWLPHGNPPGLPDDPHAAAAAASQPDINAGPRILLADDNADMRDYVARLLGVRYQCVAVQDGQLALEAIRIRRPDLVLTDIMMPRLDGFGLIHAIRQDPQLRDLPVIVISARAGEEDSVEGLGAGADDYLVKPFSARELIARVDAALAMARVRREMGEARREEARSLEILNTVGAAVAAELDLGRAVQLVTDAATELTGAAFGAFFHNVLDDQGESYMLYALSGAPRENFARFSHAAQLRIILTYLCRRGHRPRG